VHAMKADNVFPACCPVVRVEIPSFSSPKNPKRVENNQNGLTSHLGKVMGAPDVAVDETRTRIYAPCRTRATPPHRRVSPRDITARLFFSCIQQAERKKISRSAAWRRDFAGCFLRRRVCHVFPKRGLLRRNANFADRFRPIA
jgi:hypothetical protein